MLSEDAIALAAAFQAKGDWCAEHELPESVCPACRGEETPRADGPPSDGTLVRLRGERTPERVGITTAPAEPAPRTAAEIDAPARIVANPRGISRVHAPVPGVVREVLAAPGDIVVRGQILARIDSAEVGAAAPGIVSSSLPFNDTPSFCSSFTACSTWSLPLRPSLEP